MAMINDESWKNPNNRTIFTQLTRTNRSEFIDNIYSAHVHTNIGENTLIYKSRVKTENE